MRNDDQRFAPRLAARLLLCIALLGLTLSFAQADDTDETPTLDEVVVTEEKLQIPTSSSITTKLPLALQSTPASVGVVPQSLLQEQRSDILGDALKNISGVNVQTGFGTHDLFITRGFDSLANGLVLTDGAFEPEVTFYHLYNIERVELLKGPGAFLYGGNPLSGTVNLARKQPRLDDFARLNGSIGRYQSYRGGLDAGIANRDQGIALRINALADVADNYRDDKESEVFAVNPAFAWHPNDKSSIDLNVEYVNSSHKSDSGLPIVNGELAVVPRTQSYQSPFDISEQEFLRLRMDASTKVNDSVTIRNKLYYTNFDWPSKGTLINGAGPVPQVPGGLFVFRSLLLLDDHRKLLGDQLEAVLSAKTGPIQHELIAGFEFRRLGDEFTLDVANLPPIDLTNPSTSQDTEDQLIPGQSTAGDSRSLTVAPYIADQIELGDAASILVGGRYDHIDYEDTVTTTERTYSQLSPMLGLLYSATPEVSVYANAGRAFAPPSSRVVGERKAEESTQFEVGTKQQWLDKKVSTTLALYYLKKENIAIPDDLGITQETGDQESMGVELDLMAEPVDGLYAFVSYAFTDAELTEFAEQVFVFVPTAEGIVPQVFDRSGNAPAFAPKHIFNCWLSKEFTNGLGIGAGARYVGSQFIAEDNAYQIDGALTFDASVHYTYGNWRWSAHLKNLTNHEYETRGFGSTSVIPAEPFTAYSTLEFRL